MSCDGSEVSGLLSSSSPAEPSSRGLVNGHRSPVERSWCRLVRGLFLLVTRWGSIAQGCVGQPPGYLSEVVAWEADILEVG